MGKGNKCLFVPRYLFLNEELKEVDKRRSSYLISHARISFSARARDVKAMLMIYGNINKIPIAPNEYGDMFSIDTLNELIYPELEILKKRPQNDEEIEKIKFYIKHMKPAFEKSVEKIILEQAIVATISNIEVYLSWIFRDIFDDDRFLRCHLKNSKETKDFIRKSGLLKPLQEQLVLNGNSFSNLDLIIIPRSLLRLGQEIG